MSGFSAVPPPAWALSRPKSPLQSAWDFVSSPLRMVLLPDQVSERLHMTSLRGERMAAVLPELRGRVLDIGAGDNLLVRLYKERAADDPAAQQSVGADVVDWGGGCTLIKSSAELPFEDGSFDTVAFIACINHIPERREALREALRVLRPGGRVVITMIGRLVGTIGHAVWWYSEDKHRDVDEHEEMGMDRREIEALLRDAGFEITRRKGFVYRLNTLWVAVKTQ